jgi:Spy/CpxP family protein refolding chaperone
LPQLDFSFSVYTEQSGQATVVAEWRIHIVHRTKFTVLLGMMLGAGIAMAQAPDQSQAPQAAPGTTPPGTTMGRRHAPDLARQAQRLSRELGLSADQEAQIRPILADRQAQMQTLRADSSLSEEDRRSKIQSMMQESDNKIKAVLTDQQKQKFEQMNQERRARREQPPAQPQ